MLEDVAHAEHDDGVTDDEHALRAVLARDHFRGAPQAKYDVAPAFAAGRSMVELSQQSTELGLVRELLGHADCGKSVHYQRVRIFSHAGRLHDQPGGMS